MKVQRLTARKVLVLMVLCMSFIMLFKQECKADMIYTKIEMNESYLINGYYVCQVTAPARGAISVTVDHSSAESTGELVRVVYSKNASKGRAKAIEWEMSSKKEVETFDTVGVDENQKIEIYISGKNCSFRVNFVACDNYECEDNDSKLQATAIAVNKQYYGYLERGNSWWGDDTGIYFFGNSEEADWYEITISENGYIDVDFYIPPIDESWLYVELFPSYESNTALHLLYEYDEYAGGSYIGGEQLGSLRVGVKPGKYYLRIYSSKAAPYTFRVNYEKSSMWESEENDSPECADIIPLNSAKNGSMLWKTGGLDEDYFCFTLPDTRYIYLSLSNLENKAEITGSLALLDGNLNELCETSAAEGAQEKELGISGSDMPAGTYYIKVEKQNGAEPIEYKLALSAYKTPQKTKITSIKSNSYNSISLKWNKRAGASYYALYRSEIKNGTYKKIANVYDTQYTDKNLKFQKKYYYKVVVVTNIGINTLMSKDSNIVSKQTKLGKPEVKALRVSKNQARVTWKKVSGASGYEIWYSTDKKVKKNVEKIALKSGRKTSTHIKKLKGGKVYYTKVRAFRMVNGKKVYGDFDTIRKINKK